MSLSAVICLRIFSLFGGENRTDMERLEEEEDDDVEEETAFGDVSMRLNCFRVLVGT